MKKLFATAAAMAMFLSLGATTVFAADEDTKDVDVTYDNSETIVDPSDPDAGKWGVRVPASIQFTETTKSVNADLELVGLNKSVDVTVKSAKGMKLSLSDGTDELPYTLEYGSKKMDGSTPITVNLTSQATKQAGTATLPGSSIATKKGVHKDILTYTVAMH